MLSYGVRILIAPAVAIMSGVSAAEMPFQTGFAAYRMVTQEHVLDGRVEAVHRSTVAAQTAGRIVEIAYDVDDYVEEGALIVRLTDAEPRARLGRAEASLSEAEARFREASTEYERIKDVFERQLVSQSDMDRATAARDSARARLEAAVAAKAEAEEQLAYTRIRAPFAGIVIERHVEVGESVNPGQPLMTGISLQALRVNADVPQRFIHAVREHGRARVILSEDHYVDAERLTFFPYADPQTNTFRVRSELPLGTPDLFPGMLVKVAFVVGERRRLVVPEHSVVYRSELTGVYVVGDEGRISLRQIRVGRTIDGQTEVLSGLLEGQRVALEPVRAGLFLKERQERAR